MTRIPWEEQEIDDEVKKDDDEDTIMTKKYDILAHESRFLRLLRKIQTWMYASENTIDKRSRYAEAVNHQGIVGCTVRSHTISIAHHRNKTHPFRKSQNIRIHRYFTTVFFTTHPKHWLSLRNESRVSNLKVDLTVSSEHTIMQSPTHIMMCENRVRFSANMFGVL